MTLKLQKKDAMIWNAEVRWFTFFMAMDAVSTYKRSVWTIKDHFGSMRK